MCCESICFASHKPEQPKCIISGRIRVCFASTSVYAEGGPSVYPAHAQGAHVGTHISDRAPSAECSLLPSSPIAAPPQPAHCRHQRARRPSRRRRHNPSSIMTDRVRSFNVDLTPKAHHGYAVLLFIFGTLFPPLGAPHTIRPECANA